MGCGGGYRVGLGPAHRRGDRAGVELAVGVPGERAAGHRGGGGGPARTGRKPRPGTATHTRPARGGAVRSRARAADPRADQGSGLGLGQRRGPRVVRGRRGCASRVRAELAVPSGAADRARIPAYPLIRGGQHADTRRERRILLLPAHPRAVPELRVGLHAVADGPCRRPRRARRRRRRGGARPRRRPARPPDDRHRRRADLGRQPAVVPAARRVTPGLPRRLAARAVAARDRRGRHVAPARQCRPGRAGRRRQLRHRVSGGQQRPPARRRHRGCAAGDADRDAGSGRGRGPCGGDG